MAQTQVVRGRITVEGLDYDGMYYVKYHSTKVVKFSQKSDGIRVILNDGGWRTATTKLRMNQASNQWGLEYQVIQRRGDWKVLLPGLNSLHVEAEKGSPMFDKGRWLKGGRCWQVEFVSGMIFTICKSEELVTVYYLRTNTVFLPERRCYSRILQK